MTDRAEIETRVKKVLAEQLAVDEAQVVPDARFAEDLNADSLDLVEAVLALEEEWSIEIPEEEMERVKTVGQADRPGRRQARRRLSGCSVPEMVRPRERSPQRRHHRASGRSRRSASGVDDFWTGLTAGRNGVRTITRVRPSTTSRSPSRARSPASTPTDWLDPKEARRTDPFVQLRARVGEARVGRRRRARGRRPSAAA